MILYTGLGVSERQQFVVVTPPGLCLPSYAFMERVATLDVARVQWRTFGRCHELDEGVPKGSERRHRTHGPLRSVICWRRGVLVCVCPQVSK